MGLTAEQWLVRVSRAYTRAFLIALIVLFGTLGFGVWINSIGYPGANFAIALGYLVVLVYTAGHPVLLLHFFGFGMFMGLPDIELNRILRIGSKEWYLPNIRKENVLGQGLYHVGWFVRVMAHIALVTIVTFVLLGIYPIKQPGALLPLFVLLPALGLWAFLFSKSDFVYRWLTRAVIASSLTGSLLAAYKVFHPQDELRAEIGEAMRKHRDAEQVRKARPLLEKAANGTLTNEDHLFLANLSEEKDEHGLLGGLGYRKTVERRITHLRPDKLCGIRPGEYSVEVPIAYVTIDKGTFDLAQWARLNGHLTTEKVRVAEDGCVILSWAFGPRDQGRKIEPQKMAFKFSS
ncbi:MAG: hypothetical protein WDN67_00855 [Candidatus Moraniibacteriota bacterium]